MTDDREACGRCGVSIVVDAAVEEDEEQRDPYGEDRIELDETTLRRVSPAAYLESVTDRVNRLTEQLVWNR